MKIRIISRIGAESQRGFQAAQMQRLGLSFSFVDAVEATDLTDALCLEAAQTWPGATLPQDIACFHSHRKAWGQIVEDKALGLVLEDDAVLADTSVTSMTRQELFDWMNGQLRDGEMTFDESSAFLGMTLKISAVTGEQMDLATDTSRIDFTEKARQGIEFYRSHFDDASVDRLQDALDKMLAGR